MGVIHAYIKRYYRNKNNESPVIIEYSHLKKRWRINSGILVNPDHITCVFDEDLEIYKLTCQKSLKENERKLLTSANVTLNDYYQKISRAVFELTSKSLPLSPSNVKTEYLRNPRKRIERINKSVLAWYEDFIKSKEKEIGEGINSYRSTYEHFKSFTSDNGNLVLTELNKHFFEGLRDYLVAPERIELFR